MYIIHNMENKEEENPLTTHYTREKHMKGRRKGTQVRSEKLLKGGEESGKEIFLCLYIYTTIIVCFFSNKIYIRKISVFFFSFMYRKTAKRKIGKI